MDDPDSLSAAIVELTAYLYTHNQETAKADLEEEATVVSLMDNTPEDAKKMSATEANSRTKVINNNLYKQSSLEGEAIVEMVNAIKVRINVLSWEFRNSNIGK